MDDTSYEAITLWLDADPKGVPVSAVGFRLTNRKPALDIPPMPGLAKSVRRIFGRTEVLVKFEGTGQEAWLQLHHLRFPEGMLPDGSD